MSTRCDRIGCSNQARWNPVLLLYAGSDEKHIPWRAVMNMNVCDKHRDKIHVEAFTQDENWDSILNTLGPTYIVLPERELTELAWQEIEVAYAAEGVS